MVSIDRDPATAATPLPPLSDRGSGARGLIVLFVVMLLIPLSFNLGPMRLTPYRVLLLVLTVPCALRVLSGRVGGVTITDTLMVLYGIWMFVSLSAVHGTERVAFAGISSVELLGGYFAGRVLIRGPEDYRFLFKVLFVALLCLLPVALMEAVSGKLIIPDLLRPLGETPVRVWSAYGRMGLERVYLVFDHPILFGLFCSMLMTNLLLIARNGFGMVVTGGIALFAAGLSLSSGPLLACLLQFVMLGWFWIMKGRWKLLITLTGLLYLLFVIAADRSLASFVIEKLTFNSNTGWIRLAVVKHAWQNVLEHPVFGLGFNNWERPGWLTSSIDNFWLLNALRYGLPGAALVVAIYLSHIARAGMAPLITPDWNRLRVAHLITLVATGFTLTTVHVWGSLSVFVMFYIGAGAWLYTAPESSQDDGTETTGGEADRDRSPRYTRFPEKKRGPARAPRRSSHA